MRQGRSCWDAVVDAYFLKISFRFEVFEVDQTLGPPIVLQWYW